MQGRKNVKVICRDLVSWVARRVWPKILHFLKIAVFCWNFFSKNITNLVIDNDVCKIN